MASCCSREGLGRLGLSMGGGGNGEHSPMAETRLNSSRERPKKPLAWSWCVILILGVLMWNWGRV